MEHNSREDTEREARELFKSEGYMYCGAKEKISTIAKALEAREKKGREAGLNKAIEVLPKEHDEDTTSNEVGREELMRMRGFNDAIGDSKFAIQKEISK